MRVTNLSALVVSAAGLLALPLAFGQAPYSGYYGTSQTANSQGYATSRPQQADPGGSGYQSMSPDSWGSSAPATGAFSTPGFNSQNFAGQNNTNPNRVDNSFDPRGYVKTAPGFPTYQSAPTAPSPFQRQLQAGTVVPGTIAPGPTPAFSPQYEDTGAASIQTMLSDQRPTPPKQRPQRNNAFRPAEFNQNDPRDIPLAPSVPSSIVEGDNRPLDSRSLETVDSAISKPQELELAPPGFPEQTPTIEQKPMVQPKTEPGAGGQNDTASPVQAVPDEVLGNLNPPGTNVPQVTEPAASTDPVETSGVTQTPYAPFAPAGPFAPAAPSSIVQPNFNQHAFGQPTQPFLAPAQPLPGHVMQAPVINQPMLGQPTNAALTPYQMPQVFNPATVQAAAAPIQGQQEKGFGWGSAPGLFGRSKEKQQPPTYRQQEPVEPRHGPLQRQRSQPQQRPARPRIPLPFGMGGNQDQVNPSPHGLPPTDAMEAPRNTHYQTRGSQLPHLPPQGQGGANGGQPFPMMQPNRQFRPDLGQRAPLPAVRNAGTYDSGRDEYDFENKKKDYPPFSEILATGRWFGSVEAQLLTPRFNGATGLLVTDNTTPGQPIVNARAFDYDSELVPNLRFGFESKYGPGFEIDYRQLNAGSDVNQFTSAGSVGSTLEFPLSGSANSLELSAFNVGETLTGQHSMKLETFAFSVFKEVQLPITRINGLFGFQFANIEHRTSGVVESGGAVLRTGNSTSDMRALGPRLRIEYYRPLGHTPVEFITAFGGSLMFGKRDQFVNLSDGGSFVRRDVDEMVSTLDFMTGVQMRKRLNENESVFARIGFINQYFNGGGSAGLPDDNFGLRGFSFLIGVNR